MRDHLAHIKERDGRMQEWEKGVEVGTGRGEANGASTKEGRKGKTISLCKKRTLVFETGQVGRVKREEMC